MKNNTLHFNPLGNLSPDENEAAYVWTEKTQNLLKEIKQGSYSLFCISGRKGVGKTTLLQNLQFQINDSLFYSFRKGEKVNSELLKPSVLFLDRVYNLSLFERLKLWSLGKTIVYTAHIDTYGLEQLNTGRKLKAKLGAQNSNEIAQVLESKFTIHGLNMGAFGSAFSKENIELLCHKHAGNPRKIIKELYSQI